MKIDSPFLKSVREKIDSDWRGIFEREFSEEYFQNLIEFLREEYEGKTTIYPPKVDIFSAFFATPLSKIKVVILGQDPYHGVNQAHGMCFSVLPTQKKLPPSLKNIFKEITNEYPSFSPQSGYLASWAQQGVFLLNTVLTVRESQAQSHQNKGWEIFTDTIIKEISQKKENVVFLLWGKPAQNKAKYIDASKHHILTAPHPSPLSAFRGFFGCKHFTKTNQFLVSKNIAPINWIEGI
jgi:uracil-DNA glycosylase